MRSTRARLVLTFVAALGAAACAAVLGIEDRSLDDTALTAEAGDAVDDRGVTADATADVREDAREDAGTAADADTKFCDPAVCTGAGRACDGGLCTITCATGACKAMDVMCPTGNDCIVKCATGACDKVRCVGGRSCIVDCSVNDSCKNGANCTSGLCELRCTGNTACGGAGGADPCVCNADVCIVNCSGPGACNAGVLANATVSCDIACTGAMACSDTAEIVSCGTSPQASIVCGAGATTCAAKPTCVGGAGTSCSIQCKGNSCPNGLCCSTPTNCDVDAAIPNACP